MKGVGTALMALGVWAWACGGPAAGQRDAGVLDSAPADSLVGDGPADDPVEMVSDRGDSDRGDPDGAFGEPVADDGLDHVPEVPEDGPREVTDASDHGVGETEAGEVPDVPDEWPEDPGCQDAESWSEDVLADEGAEAPDPDDGPDQGEDVPQADAGPDLGGDAGGECQEVPFTPVCGYFVDLSDWPAPPFSYPVGLDSPYVTEFVKALHARGYCKGFDPSALDPATQALLKITVWMPSDSHCGFKLLRVESCPTRLEVRALTVHCVDTQEPVLLFGWGFLYLVPKMSPRPIWMPAENMVSKVLECLPPTWPEEPSPCCIPFKLDQCDSMYDAPGP